MTKQALPLGPTGSLTPGRSVAAMFELAAKPDELVASEQLRDAWGAVNHLYTHIDNRLDLDHPESKPQDAPETFLWDDWFNYLKNSEPDASMPEDGNLTGIQQQAFVGMRQHFDLLGTTQQQRSEFVNSLWMYMATASQAKKATRIIGPKGLAYWRQREAIAVAHLFTSIVPEESRGANFSRFVHAAEYMGRAFKLRDSSKDMDHDMDSRNVGTEPWVSRYALLFGWTALQGLRAIKGRTHMIRPFLQKSRAVRKNRDGNLNDQRIHV